MNFSAYTTLLKTKKPEYTYLVKNIKLEGTQALEKQTVRSTAAWGTY